MNESTHDTMIIPIDLDYRGLEECVGAYLVRTPVGPVLVECGPAKCVPRLEEGLHKHGHSLEDIRHVFLTHIHLDHAGATAACTAAGAIAHVHPRGARHLVDPSRLMASAIRVFGDALEEDLGMLEPSPADLIDAVEDGGVVELGTMRFQAVETLGHAKHHHAWVLEHEGSRHVFTGDTAGMRLPGSAFPTLPLVAPDLDPAAWIASIQKVRELSADALWLTHYGQVDDQQSFLDETAERIRSETSFIRALLEDMPDASEMDRISSYRTWHQEQAATHGVDMDLLERHCTDHHYRANLQGVGHFLGRS